MYEALIEINRYSGIPGIVFFLAFLTKKGYNIRIVFFVLLASFLADFANYFFIRYIYQNSFIISNSWWLINYFLLTWLFLTLLKNQKNFVLLFFSIFLAGSLISFSFFYSFLESNTFIRTFSSISFTFLCILSFFEILRVGPTDQLSTYPIFWVTTAIFLYSSITLLRHLFSNYLIFQMDLSTEVYSYVHFFNLLMNIIKNLMFFYAFTLVRKGYPDYINKPALNSK